MLLLVSWAEDGALIGVTPRGVVYASGDGGLTWDTRGTLNGLAEAVEATSGREIYAAADSAVLVSRDGGRTFAPLTPERALTSIRRSDGVAGANVIISTPRTSATGSLSLALLIGWRRVVVSAVATVGRMCPRAR